jgi:hypothetical protein
MKDKQFFLDKANALLTIIEQSEKEGRNTTISDSTILSEMELMFFGFNENYPALYDLKQLKVNYMEDMRKGNKTIKPLKEHLFRFINFVNEYQ